MKPDMGIISLLYVLLGFTWFLIWPFLLVGKLYPSRERLINLFILPCFVSVALTATAYTASTKSEYCGLCHSMKPYIETWQTSTHAEVDCYRCHSDTGSLQWGYARVKEIYETVTNRTAVGAQNQPTDKSVKDHLRVSQETCRSCHIIPKKLVHTDGIVVSHGKHDEKGISCTYCHNRIVHLRQIDSNMVQTKEESKLGMFLGTLESQINIEPDRTRMQFCMRCHNGGNGKMNAPRDCRACHTSDYKLKPMNHLISGFLPKPLAGGTKSSKHGEGAKMDKEYCLSCHTEKKCFGCHGSVTMPHPTKNWISGKNLHAILNKEKPRTCVLCHNQPGCTTCHHRDWRIAAQQWWNKNNPATSKHIQIVRTEGPAACVGCHAPVFCWNCHVASKPENK